MAGWGRKVRPVPPSEAGPAESPDERRSEPTVRVPPGLQVPTYPVVVNAPVKRSSTTSSPRTASGSACGSHGRVGHSPMIQRIFRERGLPEELAYTAMIESGFSPRAVSRVGAKGMWQFMEATGRRYGLRHQPLGGRASRSGEVHDGAAEYLGDLYGLFGHWFLAQAGYNAGESRVGPGDPACANERLLGSDPDAASARRDQALRSADPRRGGDHAGAHALWLRRHARASTRVR